MSLEIPEQISIILEQDLFLSRFDIAKNYHSIDRNTATLKPLADLLIFEWCDALYLEAKWVEGFYEAQHECYILCCNTDEFLQTSLRLEQLLESCALSQA